MNKVTRILVVAHLALVMLFSVWRDCVWAQTAAPAVDPAITNLAVRLSEALHKAKGKRVIVLDLKGPQGEAHAVGKWLADQLSDALRRGNQELDVLERSAIESRADAGDAPATDEALDKRTIELARSAGANAVVIGSFAKVENLLGISLNVRKPDRPGNLLGQVTGTVPISEEIAALSANPIPTFKGEVARAGVGGVTNPRCIYCPNPEYSAEARAANYQGFVALKMLVNAEGRVANVWIVKSPGLGLDEKAIQVVKQWRFKPAEDASGKPVAVTLPVEITFRMYP